MAEYRQLREPRPDVHPARDGAEYGGIRIAHGHRQLPGPVGDGVDTGAVELRATVEDGAQSGGDQCSVCSRLPIEGPTK